MAWVLCPGLIYYKERTDSWRLSYDLYKHAMKSNRTSISGKDCGGYRIRNIILYGIINNIICTPKKHIKTLFYV